MDIGTIITTYDIAVTDAAGRTSVGWGGTMDHQRCPREEI